MVEVSWRRLCVVCGATCIGRCWVRWVWRRFGLWQNHSTSAASVRESGQSGQRESAERRAN